MQNRIFWDTEWRKLGLGRPQLPLKMLTLSATATKICVMSALIISILEEKKKNNFKNVNFQQFCLLPLRQYCNTSWHLPVKWAELGRITVQWGVRAYSCGRYFSINLEMGVFRLIWSWFCIAEIINTLVLWHQWLFIYLTGFVAGKTRLRFCHFGCNKFSLRLIALVA